MVFKNKITIITGGGQGIGATFAREFGKKGAKVIIADINYKEAAKTAEDIKKTEGEAFAIEVDIRSQESCESMASTVVERYGTIDILINNASIFSTIKMKPFHEISLDEWNAVMNVNLGGAFLCCKAVVPFMKAQGKGKIVNISSAAVFMGRPYYLHYITSKAGIIGFTRALARELGEWKINVNSVAPGATKTEVPRETVSPEQMQAMINQRCIKRVEVPEDLVGTIMFLASEQSDFISGETITVDGGLAFH